MSREPAVVPICFLCPACRAPLVAGMDDPACHACSKKFPSCSSLPILVQEPEGVLAAAQTFVRHGLGQIRRLRASVLQSRSPTPARERLRGRVLEGLRVNWELLQRLAASLPRELLFDPESAPSDSIYQTFDMVSRYAVRDWSGERYSEEQVLAVERVITRGFPASYASSGRAIVLGAGTCRVAHDLTSAFSQVVACDRSLPMLLAYDSLREAPAKYVEINFVNTETTKGQVHEVTLSTRHQERSPARPDRLRVVVCDAAHLPIADESTDVVFSIYFTDVIGLAAILPEVRRVLVKDGLFVHFGTLGYHQGRLSELLSVEDVREGVESGGFHIESERWVSTKDIGARPDRLATVLLRNWHFVARKTYATRTAST
jgi:SAM-dependent methyltransferase